MSNLSPDVGGQRCPDSVPPNYCAMSVGQNQVQIRNPDTRKPSRLKNSDLTDRHRTVNPDKIRTALSADVCPRNPDKKRFWPPDKVGKRIKQLPSRIRIRKLRKSNHIYYNIRLCSIFPRSVALLLTESWCFEHYSASTGLDSVHDLTIFV